MKEIEKTLKKIHSLLLVLVVLSAVSVVWNVVESLRWHPILTESQDVLNKTSFDDEMMDLVERNELEQVIRRCDAREKSHPNDIYVYYYRGMALYLKGEEAERDFLKVIEIDPSWSESVAGYLEDGDE